MSKFLALLCLIAAALFIGGSFADTCLSYAGPLGKGAGCWAENGNALQCKRGLTCSQEGVCVSRTKEGEDCKDIECDENLDCRGPDDDSKRCYTRVHPGQDCVDYSGHSGPGCGTGMCENGRCRGGMLGDACYEDDDCEGDLTCTDRICTGLAIGATCTSTDDCVVGSYCHSTTEVCTAFPTSGNCTLSERCAHGYACILTSEDALFPQCVALGSLADGSFCYTNDNVCTNLRCHGGYCAAASPKYCDATAQCAGDEACTCGGDAKSMGIGSCTAKSCTKLTKAYNDCFAQFCRSSTYFNGSCIQRNCDSEYRKYQVCSSASSLLVSLLSVSFVALFVSFFGKHF